MAGREVYEDMSSSQEREVGFQAKIRKLRKELDETECMRKEGLERRKKTWRAKGSVEDVREIQKPGDQTTGSQKEGNDENQLPEELRKERDESGIKRAEERWKVTFESEVEKEVGRRMRARETSEDMTDEMDELAINQQQQERHKEPRRQDRHHQPEERRNMATPANTGGFHMTRRPGRSGKERDKCYSQRMPLNDGAKAKRLGDGKQEAGARK